MERAPDRLWLLGVRLTEKKKKEKNNIFSKALSKPRCSAIALVFCLPQFEAYTAKASSKKGPLSTPSMRLVTASCPTAGARAADPSSALPESGLRPFSLPLLSQYRWIHPIGYKPVETGNKRCEEW